MPSGVEVAQAYITIIPSMKGIQGTIAKELNADVVGEKAGKALGSGMEKGAKKSGDDLMKSFGSVGDRIAFKTQTGLSTAFKNVADGAKQRMGTVATNITDKFKAVSEKIGNTGIGKVLSKAAEVGGAAFTKLTGTVRGVAQFAGDAFKTVSGTIQAHLAPIAEKAAPIFQAVSGAASTAFQAVAKAAAVGSAAAVASLGAIVTSSLNSFADYEQLSGGIAKLYGNGGMALEQYAQSVGKATDEVAADYQRNERAQQMMLDNAQKAYQTAGMSANEYMEQATSFSAALIKSVGGDTEEASRLTDVAMRAMSDNVNTFGSNAQDVQNAVMGISRENYSMLDNLKLGYAGTKEGMLQLVNDSGVLGKTLTDTSELGEVGFGKMIEAIQAVQEQQNIAGTTAREAAGTISGSIEMTKAAWTNLVAEMGKDDGDVSARVGELVDSAVAVMENVGPRVATIVSTIIDKVPPAIAANAPKVGKALTNMLDSVTNGAFGKAVSAIKPYADRIGTAMGGLWDRLKPLAPVVQEIGGKLGGILLKGLSVATGAFERVAPIVATIAEHALPILSTALDIASKAFDGILKVAEPVATFLTDSMGSAIDWVGGKLEEFAEFVNDTFGAIADALGAVGDFLKDPLGKISDFTKKAGKSFQSTADTAAKSAEKAASTTKKGYGEVSKSVADSTAKAATSANKNMGDAATSVSKQSSTAATSAEKNGQRIEKAWNKTYTTKLDATANTSSAETSMSAFKNKWTDYKISGSAALGTATASKTLSDWIYRNNNFVLHGSIQIKNNATTTTKGYMAAGGIVVKHADGFIADRPNVGVDITHIVGERGAEAVIPLTSRAHVAPFARTVADFINEDRGGDVIVTGNTFIVRRESDIAAIGRQINQQAERERRSSLK